MGVAGGHMSYAHAQWRTPKIPEGGPSFVTIV